MKTSRDALSRIVQSFRPSAEVGPLRPLKGGISSGVAAFTVTCAGAREQMVLRELGPWALARLADAAQVEFGVLAELGRQDYPASRPYYVSPPDAATPLLIVSFLPGEISLTPADPQNYVRQMAEALARLHALEAEGFSFVPEMSGEIAHHIDWSPVRRSPVPDERHVRKILAEHWPFDNLNAAVLLHGDFWPGNLLWSDETLTAVLDWEDAGLGDPLLDVAVTRQELAFAFDLDMAEAFTDAYAALTALDWANLPLWDLYASLRPIDQFSIWAGGWADLGRPEVTAETLRTAHAELVARALERLGA